MRNPRIHAPTWRKRWAVGLGGLAFLILSLPISAQEAPPSTHHRFNLAVKPIGSQASSGLALAVTTGSRREGQVILRVGIRNTGPNIYVRPMKLYADDFRVISSKSYRRMELAEIPKPLLFPIPRAGLRSGISTASEISFTAPQDETDFELQVTGFPSLKMKFIEENQFRAPSVAKISPGLTLDPVEGALGVVDLKISSIAYDGTNLDFEIGFLNGGRAPVLFNGPLKGGSARFLDGEAGVHGPTLVTGGIEKSLGPIGRNWKVGEVNPGRVRFTGIHPHALVAGRFLFPGYPPLHLSWNSTAGTFTATPVATPARAGAGLTGANAEQKRFEELRTFFEDLNGKIARRDRIGFLLGFSDTGHLRARQTELLETFDQLPIKEMRYQIPAHQSIRADADGGASNVMVELRYQFDGVEKDNVFRSLIRCDFVREPKSGKIQIRAMRTVKHPPFWTLGYTAFEATDHFLLFYRPGTVTEDLLRKTTKQVESSYRELAKRKLPLEQRYIAFFLPFKEDFIQFTGRDPNKFNGVAATFFEEDNGEIRTGNRAMYINDHRFLVEQQAWGLRDRQTTITHELVHLSLAHSTRPYSPGWLVEGVALNYAKQINSFTQHSLGTKGWLPRISLQSLSTTPMLGKNTAQQELITMQYFLSGEAVAFLRREFGDAKVIKFYEAFGELSPKEMKTFVQGGELSHKTLPQVTQRLTEHLVANHFQMTLKQLDEAVRGHVAQKTRWAR